MPPQRPAEKCLVHLGAELLLLQGRLIVFYENGFIQSAQRHSDVPRLTDQQLKAIEVYTRCLYRCIHRCIHRYDLMHDGLGFSTDAYTDMI